MNNLVLLTSTSGLDAQWVTDFLDLFSKVLTNVFLQFPLNLMLVGALASVAVSLFGRAKRAIH